MAVDPELAQLQEQLRQRDIRDEIRDLCESAEVKLTSVQMEAACGLSTTEKRKAYVEAMKGTAGANTNRTARPPLTAATPLTEGREPVKKPANAKEFAALVR